VSGEPFNEQRLLADVAKQWGEHGAHADVLRALIPNLECGTANPSFATLTADLAAERAEVERLRAAGDALAEVADEWPELVEAWQEARRER
jgi:hypothetical protein